MKKALLLLLFIPFVFNSCSDDDDNYSDSDLIGKWEWIVSEGWEYEDGKKITFSESYVDDEDPTYKIFNADGTGTQIETGFSDTPFTWSLKGNKLTMITRLEADVVKIATLNSSILAIEYSGTDDGDKYYVKNTFRKVK